MDYASVLELKSRTRDKDTLALIEHIETQNSELLSLAGKVEDGNRTITKLEKIVARLSGNQKVPPCPCLNPDDHAGWCPRRER